MSQACLGVAPFMGMFGSRGRNNSSNPYLGVSDNKSLNVIYPCVFFFISFYTHETVKFVCPNVCCTSLGGTLHASNVHRSIFKSVPYMPVTGDLFNSFTSFCMSKGLLHFFAVHYWCRNFIECTWTVWVVPYMQPVTGDNTLKSADHFLHLPREVYINFICLQIDTSFYKE